MPDNYYCINLFTCTFPKIRGCDNWLIFCIMQIPVLSSSVDGFIQCYLTWKKIKPEPLLQCVTSRFFVFALDMLRGNSNTIV